MSKDARIVALMTAGGLKDPAATERQLGETPMVEGSLDSVLRVLSTSYGYCA